MKTWWLTLTVLCLAAPSSGFAQQARYQLGKQVIGFETAFQQSMSQLESRKAVLPSLERAVQAFFSMSFSGAEKFDRRCLAQTIARGTASRDCTAYAPSIVACQTLARYECG